MRGEDKGCEGVKGGRIVVVEFKGCGHLWNHCACISCLLSLSLPSSVSVFPWLTGCWLTERGRWDMGSSRFVWPWGFIFIFFILLHIRWLMCLCCYLKLLFYSLAIFLFYNCDLPESNSYTLSPPFIFLFAMFFNWLFWVGNRCNC